MKFLCLICGQTVMDWVTEADVEEYGEFTDDLKRVGRLIGCNRLVPPDGAVTLRVRDGKVLTTDGPFVQTREHLGGYYIIEARDLAEAIQVASGIPGAKVGCVEVRPIAEDERTAQALGFARGGR